MVPSFSFNNINFTFEDGKYIGLLNFKHIKTPNGSPGKNHLEGSVRVDGQEEHHIDLVFGCSVIFNLKNLLSPFSIKIQGGNNVDNKMFSLNLTPALRPGGKSKIEGNYGSRPIAIVTGSGFDSIEKVFRTLISFTV